MESLNALPKFLEQLRGCGIKNLVFQLIVHSPLCGATLSIHACHRYVSFGRISKITGRSIVYLKIPGSLEGK